MDVRAPEVDEDAAQVLEECEASSLAASIARAEGVTTVTLSVLAGLGVGSAAGVVLKECSSATEAAAARKAIVQALMNANGRLAALGHGRGEGEDGRAGRGKAGGRDRGASSVYPQLSRQRTWRWYILLGHADRGGARIHTPHVLRR